jgi:hypothetical protein
MIFSEEMDNAKKYGYKFEILWGYKFERKNIFNGYVTALYELRLKFPKSNPLNLVAKLLLNSLYGRFGMIDSFPNITIFKNLKTFKSWFNIHNEDVISFNELGDRVLVKHRSELQNQQTELYGTLETHNISIAIASAITAYARIHMSQFKNNPKINLYYTDTDSIYTDSDIDESFISDTILGKLKIEHICKKAIFLSPKVYCLETIDKEFIYKVKGLKHEIELTMKDFKNLLCKDAFIEKFQTKWMKNLSKGQIKLLESIYTLKVTDNKRQLVYDKNNKLISTKAYRINKDKEII